MNRKTSWLERHWVQLVIALAVTVIAGSVLYYLVVKPNDDLCTRRFLGWEWRKKDCNVLKEFFN